MRLKLHYCAGNNVHYYKRSTLLELRCLDFGLLMLIKILFKICKPVSADGLVGSAATYCALGDPSLSLFPVPTPFLSPNLLPC